MRDVIVLGSGMAGLGASYRLRQERVPHTVFDMNPHPGGHTFSHVDPQGFVFDEGPHISFTKDTRIQQLFAENLKGEYEAFSARVNNYWQGYWIKHPAQCNLHGLPVAMVTDLLVDLIEARGNDAKPANYEDWLVASFGRKFAQTFPMQYGRKYHTTEASNMSLDWLGPRLYRPSLKEVLQGALTSQTEEVHYITDFRYPKRGGFLSFIKPMIAASDVRLGHRLVKLDARSQRLTFANGAIAEYDHLVSSIPLPELIKLIPDAPADVRAAAAQLACSKCVVVNIGLDRPDISDWHWTYFYDDDFSFSRISFPHMFSPGNAPAGKGSIQCEVYFSDKYKPLSQSPDSLIPRVLDDLKRCGLVKENDRVLHQSAILVSYANVIFDLDRAAALATVHGYLDDLGVRCCGRYGEWGYLWTDESFMSGERAADRVLAAMATSA